MRLTVSPLSLSYHLSCIIGRRKGWETNGWFFISLFLLITGQIASESLGVKGRGWLVRVYEGMMGVNLIPFWAAAPKDQCPVEHRENFQMFVRPSISPSPPWPLRPYISPPRPQFSPPGLKPALLASNLPYRPHICPPDLQSTLQASYQLFVPQIYPLDLKYTLQA